MLSCAKIKLAEQLPEAFNSTTHWVSGSAMRKVRVLIRLKPTLMDAQGAVLKRALRQLGYNSVADVRVGKLIELAIDCDDDKKAMAQVKEMCQRLLANPVIEEFEVLEETTSKNVR